MENKPLFQSNQINRGNRNLGRLILQLRRLERQPQTFGNAGSLTPSEIHTIEAIGFDGGVLMSELSARLGVTKGAITQIVARLEAKALVTRSPHPSDLRASVIALTEKGREAFTAHEEVHLQFYDELRSQLSDQEIEIFETCIEKLNDFLQK
ncbi:MarR family winged helix-turn-helix transcriptional regulator [Paenibacillus eucommiae]|uniref:DNA-binding MarR family transcriptional regulator n=1 Tax=Paenibacillus eucommiae TaxID=1355755 RepID=A0ABS4IMQ8_9BACL|nr:MarR family transcriptional regulator [Paenibacillus eucommiae]MBP1988854.1 DNA-binding MarR family transcriptional regulator [Paenibacillus eucommiae]